MAHRTRGSPLPHRAATAALGMLLLVAILVAPASAEAPVQLDPQGTSVAAYGGWAAWSRADSATGRYALVTRSPQGAIALPGVAESASPFDVELGPAGGSAVLAVYSRCADTRRLKGCRIASLDLGLAGAGERALVPP